MIAYQPDDDFLFRIIQAQIVQRLLRQNGSFFRVVSPRPFSDVVQQDGDVQGAARLDERRVRRLFRALQKFQRFQRVFVGRVNVVHIELHLPRNALEHGNHLAQRAGVQHCVQNALRPFGQQNVEKHRARLREFTYRADFLDAPDNRLQRVRRWFRARFVHQPKQFQQIRRADESPPLERDSAVFQTKGVFAVDLPDLRAARQRVLHGGGEVFA